MNLFFESRHKVHAHTRHVLSQFEFLRSCGCRQAASGSSAQTAPYPRASSSASVNTTKQHQCRASTGFRLFSGFEGSSSGAEACRSHLLLLAAQREHAFRCSDRWPLSTGVLCVSSVSTQVHIARYCLAPLLFCSAVSQLKHSLSVSIIHLLSLSRTLG